MTAAREEELFLEFKRRPTQDALARLLLGYQDHIEMTHLGLVQGA